MEISSHIFKLAIFSKFFGDLMSHIIRRNADEEMKTNLYPLKILDLLLTLFQVPTLYIPINQSGKFDVPNILETTLLCQLLVIYLDYRAFNNSRVDKNGHFTYHCELSTDPPPLCSCPRSFSMIVR